MGCFDIYCFLCGNTCHKSFLDIERWMEIIKNHEESIKANKSKSKTEEYARLYKYHNINKDKITKQIKQLNNDTKWADKCTIMTIDDRVIHGCKEDHCNDHFSSNQGGYTHLVDYTNMGANTGIFIHTDCWNYIKKTYGIQMKYSDLPRPNDIVNNKVFTFLKYEVEKYWGQYFDFENVLVDGNQSLCMSPMKSINVQKQIRKNFSKLKIRIDRSSPRSSASFYQDGDIKIGVDGNFWIIKRGKWTKMIGEIKTEIADSKSVKNAKFIGEINRKPIFIKSMKKDNKGKIKSIVIISQ